MGKLRGTDSELFWGFAGPFGDLRSKIFHRRAVCDLICASYGSPRCCRIDGRVCVVVAIHFHRRPRLHCYRCDCAVARYTLRLHNHSCDSDNAAAGGDEEEQRRTRRAAITWQVRFFKVKGVKEWCTAQAAKLANMLSHMTLGFEGNQPWFADLMVLLTFNNVCECGFTGTAV